MLDVKLTKLDKLFVLRRIAEEAWKDLDEDPRKEIIHALGTMFRKPLVEYQAAYSQFISTIQLKSGTFDRWLNVQIQLVTALGEHGDCLHQFITLYEEVLDGTDGGEIGEVKPENWQDLSFVLGLVMRVYGDGLQIGAIIDNPDNPAEDE